MNIFIHDLFIKINFFIEYACVLNHNDFKTRTKHAVAVFMSVM